MDNKVQYESWLCSSRVPWANAARETKEPKAAPWPGLYGAMGEGGGDQLYPGSLPPSRPLARMCESRGASLGPVRTGRYLRGRRPGRATRALGEATVARGDGPSGLRVGSPAGSSLCSGMCISDRSVNLTRTCQWQPEPAEFGFGRAAAGSHAGACGPSRHAVAGPGARGTSAW